MLAKNPWLQCGSQRIRWDKFCELCSILWEECVYENRMQMSIDAAKPEVLEFLRNLQNNRYRLHYPGAPHVKHKGSENTLLDLLSLRRGLCASDPRDRVFAHLGLASDY
jgi:hypothetical protein